MSNINPRLGKLVESLLDRYKLPADCRELRVLFANKGFEVSHSSWYAWKKNKLGISDAKKRGLAEVLNFDYEEFNAYLDGKISLEDLESSEQIKIPLDEKDIAAWIKTAEPGDLLAIQQLITNRLIQCFDSEFGSLEAIINYSLRELTEKAIANAKEEGKLILESEAFKEAIAQFAASSGLKIPELEKLIQNPDAVSPKQIQGIANAIGWEPAELQEIIEQKATSS